MTGSNQKSSGLNEGVYRTLLESMDVGFQLCELIRDRAGRASDYIVLDLNSAFAKELGLIRDEVLGRKASKFATKIGLVWLEHFNEAVLTGTPLRFEEYYPTFDRWFEVKVYPFGENDRFAVILTNITQLKLTDGMSQAISSAQNELTERRRTETELVRLMQRLDAHMNNSPLAVVEFDSEYHVIRWSSEAERLFGWTAQEIIGKSMMELRWVHEDEIEKVAKVSKEMSRGKCFRNLNVNRNYRKDGTIIYCEWYNSAIYDNDGELTSVLSLILNITERLRGEEALRESEATLALSQKLAHIGSWSWDPATHHEYWSDELYRILGLLPREIEPDYRVYLEFIHPDDRDMVNKAIARSEKGKKISLDYRIQRKDGTERFIHSEREIIWSPQGQPVKMYGTVKDITNIKKAEIELEAHQEQLAAFNQELKAQQTELNATYQELQRQAEVIRDYAAAATRARDEAERRATELDAIISSIAAAVIIYDNNGNITRMNEFARGILEQFSSDYNPNLGYPERKIQLNLCKANGIPYEPEELPIYRALLGEIIRDEEILVARDKDNPLWLSGTLAPIRDSNQGIVGVIFIFTDITERKRRVENLLASERELLKVTLNSLGEAVVAADQEGRIILINEAASNLTGYSSAEAMGEVIARICYIIDDQTSEPIDIKEYFRPAIKPVLVTRDLREIAISINSAPIRANNGQIIGTVTVFQDITEQQKTEEELLRTHKLESLGILAGGIAHDFNNILAAILANIQLASLKLKKNEDISNYLSSTAEISRKASELTKQLLTFSKGGAPVRKEASLIDLIKDTAEFVLRGTKIKVKFAIPDDLWAASVDEGQISQVLHNLVLNAQQAMPKGGIINIKAENTIVGENSRIQPGQYVKITVADQGEGISKENLVKIFDPFFTTKKEGSGLGLATSYSIITRHNGYIEVESQEGVGTTFSIFLPAVTEVIPESDSEKEVAVVSEESLRILLMDDEEKILSSVGEMLEYYGHQVTVTPDGSGAIALYKEAKLSGEPYDVVIMDLTVPGGMGGQVAVAHLRDFDPKIKAIVSSGYANDPIMAEYERYGFSGVVCKPYKIDELREVLRQLIIQWPKQ